MSKPLVSSQFNINVCDKTGVSINGLNKKSIINSNLLGLNYYEVVASKRSVDTDFSKIEISKNQILRIFKDVFRCSICLSIFNEPVNIKNCLHKFCKKCIEDYNRKIKKECAICRTFIETRRHMRDDINMAKIISCFIKNVNSFNNQENDYIETAIPEWCSNHEKKILELYNSIEYNKVNSNDIKEETKEDPIEQKKTLLGKQRKNQNLAIKSSIDMTNFNDDIAAQSIDINENEVNVILIDKEGKRKVKVVIFYY